MPCRTRCWPPGKASRVRGRASMRTWLYRIATNRCLDARRSARRRPAKEWDVPGIEPPEPTRLGEVVWLEPFPDAVLEDAIGVPLGPEARYEQTESISLAFVTALKSCRPASSPSSSCATSSDSTRARWPTCSTRPSSRSTAPSNGRAPACSAGPLADDREPPPAAGSPAEDALVAEFVRAYESADLDALVALLTEDVFMSMPPMPFEYEGRDIVARFCAGLFGAGRRSTSCRRERTASRRSAPTCAPRRHPPRDRPLRPHPRRRPDLRHDPLREQRAPMVRAAAIAPEPIASFQTMELRAAR